MLTPVEEVVATLDAMVRAGKVRYVGLSDTPAWYLARAQTLALRGWERIVSLQLEYSLVERTMEREHVPAALELGMGICVWSPLASGFLAGKYRRGARGEVEGAGRLDAVKSSGNPAFDKFTERNWRILDVLLDVARELGSPPARVALCWAATRPGVTSTLVGATRVAQLEDNLGALALEIPPPLMARLEEATRLDASSPYLFFRPAMQRGIQGGVPVRREPPWFRGG